MWYLNTITIQVIDTLGMVKMNIDAHIKKISGNTS